MIAISKTFKVLFYFIPIVKMSKCHKLREKDPLMYEAVSEKPKLKEGQRSTTNVQITTVSLLAQI